MTTDLNDLEAEPETEEPIAPVITDLNDLKDEPKTEGPIAPVTKQKKALI